MNRRLFGAARAHRAILGAIAAAVAVALSAAGGIAGEESDEAAKETSAAQLASGDVIKRGAAVGESPVVTLADVMKNPSKFADKAVVFEGTIAEVCQKKGCWMEVTPGGDNPGVRVTFKDYGFFVPKDAHGLVARAEGVFHTKVWSKEDADHLEGEGAQLVRNEDGTATELGFVASGVELRKPAKPKKTDAEKPRAGDGE